MSKMTPEFFEGVMWAVNQLTDSAQQLLTSKEALIGIDSYAYNLLGQQSDGRLDAADFLLTKTKEANGWPLQEKLPTL